MTQICATLAAWLTEPQPASPDWSPTIWETFQLVSRVHGVAPLLHLKSQSAPGPIKTWLAQQYQFNTQRLARMQAELKAILALFNQQQLAVIPLKGSVVSTQYYPEAGLRPMADLDLLIQPPDFPAAAQLLAQLGYQPNVAHWKHTEFVKPENRAVVSLEYEHPDNPRKLEIHLRCREVFAGPEVELTQLMWSNATPEHFLGETALLVKPEVLWLHLIVHATYHLWQGKGRLLHLVDLAQVTPHVFDPLAWLNRLDARFTYPSLALLHRYFPHLLDHRILTAQQARVSASFRRWVNSLNLVNISQLNPKPPGLYLLKALKFSQGRPGEVALALRWALLPSLEEIALDHPRLAQSKIPWLAYFLLPLDWARRINIFGRVSSQ